MIREITDKQLEKINYFERNFKGWIKKTCSTHKYEKVKCDKGFFYAKKQDVDDIFQKAREDRFNEMVRENKNLVETVGLLSKKLQNMVHVVNNLQKSQLDAGEHSKKVEQNQKYINRWMNAKTTMLDRYTNNQKTCEDEYITNLLRDLSQSYYPPEGNTNEVFMTTNYRDEINLTAYAAMQRILTGWSQQYGDSSGKWKILNQENERYIEIDSQEITNLLKKKDLASSQLFHREMFGGNGVFHNFLKDLKDSGFVQKIEEKRTSTPIEGFSEKETFTWTIYF